VNVASGTDLKELETDFSGRKKEISEKILCSTICFLIFLSFKSYKILIELLIISFWKRTLEMDLPEKFYITIRKSNFDTY